MGLSRTIYEMNSNGVVKICDFSTEIAALISVEKSQIFTTI